MRLSKLVIRNFKAIREIEFTIPDTDPERVGSADFLSLVGENNTAKSSVLEALILALPTTGQTRPTLDHFRGRNEENGPIEVELHFDDLTDHDEAEQGIRTHVFEGEYKVKKVWASANSPATIWAFEPVYEIPTWPDPDTSMASFRDGGVEWTNLLDAYEQEFGGVPPRVNSEFRENLRELAVTLNSPLVVEGEATWVQNPGGFSAHVDSILPLPIHIPAIKETKEADVAQKKSAIRQIVEVMFVRELAANPAIELFTQAGEDVKQLFAGEEGDEIIRRIETRIGDGIKRFIDLDASLEFEPPDIKAELASKTSLLLVDGGLQTKPEHQGHGAQRALVLSLLEILSEDSLSEPEGEFLRGILLLIEEPEIYMHPQMCRKMRDVLLSIAKSGTAQVICTTHSPVFLDLADRHDGIAILRRRAGDIEAAQRTDDIFEHGDAESDRARLRMLLNFDPAVNEVFFAREVCLVEGDSEIAAVDATARRMAELGLLDWESYLLVRRDLVLVNCRGKWTIKAFQRVLNGFQIPYKVIHDLDEEGEDGANAAILNALGGEEERRLTHDPDFEQQLFGEVWTKDKPWRATRAIGRLDQISDDLSRFFTFSLGCEFEGLQ